MSIEIFEHLDYKKLLHFTMPSIIMLVVSSVYGVVDGYFVSNYVGKVPFAAINFIIPFLMLFSSLGFMFGTGGGALISKTFGEGDMEKARQLFSLIVYTTAACGFLLMVLGQMLIFLFAVTMGAEGELLEYSVIYGRIILMAVPVHILQYEFQCLAATSGKPALGLYVTLVSGFANVILDAVFLKGFCWGIRGVAAATVVSQCIGGIIPLLYFTFPNGSLLRLGKTKFNGKALLKICFNGSSELMNNISMSVVSMLYNVQLLRYAGENGIAIYGVLMYVSVVFENVFMGYSVGAAPIIGYHYGAQNHKELKGILRKSFVLLTISAAAMFLISICMSRPLCSVFLGYDESALNSAVHAFSLFSFAFLFSGYVIFGSAFFTALNNGIISMALSAMRTFLFQSIAVLVLPLFFGVDGIWSSLVVSEMLIAGVTFLLLKLNQKKYQYG